MNDEPETAAHQLGRLLGLADRVVLEDDRFLLVFDTGFERNADLTPLTDEEYDRIDGHA